MFFGIEHKVCTGKLLLLYRYEYSTAVYVSHHGIMDTVFFTGKRFATMYLERQVYALLVPYLQLQILMCRNQNSIAYSTVQPRVHLLHHMFNVVHTGTGVPVLYLYWSTCGLIVQLVSTVLSVSNSRTAPDHPKIMYGILQVVQV